LPPVGATSAPRWWSDFRLSFDESLIADRHFLSQIEAKVGIGSIDETLYDNERSSTTTTIETLRLILAQKFDNKLNFRELPVSLLRLYFSGQRRLKRCIERLSPQTLNKLYQFLLQDHFPPSPSIAAATTIKDEWQDIAYLDKCERLECYLTEILDQTLSSFESCLSRVISNEKWHRFHLTESLAQDSYWCNLPVPEGDSNHYTIWYTCVWRMNVTLLVESLLEPWENEESKEWLGYQFKLFRDTHLDLLSMMVKRGHYEDKVVGTMASGLLRDFYPLANRVCCAEELPDFITYTTDNFKTGSNLKERSSLDDKIGHLFVNKTGPNICKIRNFFDIIIRYGEDERIIYDILKNVIKCVLLGNLPHSRGSLDIVARIKINLSFFSEEADAPISEEEFREITKNKSLKRKRSKKKTKNELLYPKTRLKLWLLLCRHFGLFLLKEFLFYIAESSHCFNEILSVDYKFLQYREIVLTGNGRCRTELSRQAKERALWTSFDWSVIEFEEKSNETYDTKSGEIKKFHAWALKVARKVQKDDFMKILAKKMTNTEESITLAKDYTPFYYVETRGETASPERCISLDELHFICWCMAKNRSRVMETRWFQVMGMSRKGLETLRDWLFMYNTYDVPDNSFKALIMDFQIENMKDYMILKTVLKLIEYYKNEQLFHLPLYYAKKQIYALRRLLGVQDWEPTPPLLGFSYQCPGCHKFANAIIEPLDHTCQPQTTVTTKTTTTAAVKKQETLVKRDDGEVSKKRGRKTKLRKNNDKLAVETQPSATTTKNTTLTVANNVTTTCFLNMAFYNMDDGKLYCSKYSTGYKHTVIDEADNEKAHQVIMRRKDNTIVVESSKTVVLLCTNEEASQPIAKKKNKKEILEQQEEAEEEEERYFYSDKNVRERANKEFQWLMELRRFELNDANGDQSTNDLSSGLFARVQENDEDSPDDILTSEKVAKTTTTSKTTAASATTTSPVMVKKKNNKKIILGYVNEAIIDKGYTCNSELICEDMVGVVKNGNALCVECGSMTQFKNHNMTNYGITCGRHKSLYESDYELSIKSQDKRLAKKHLLLTREEEIPLAGEENQTAAAMMMGNVKNPLHPLDIVQKNASLSLPRESYIESSVCAYCMVFAPKKRITVKDSHFKLLKVALCKTCYKVSETFTRQKVPDLEQVYLYLKNKKPL
jgi:hypothetical protein